MEYFDKFSTLQRMTAGANARKWLYQKWMREGRSALLKVVYRIAAQSVRDDLHEFAGRLQ
jgi:hypothetical protein